MGPSATIERIVYLLDRGHEPAHRVKAFAKAAGIVADVGDDELARLAAEGRLTELDGIGPTIAGVLDASLRGETPSYLNDLEDRTVVGISPEGAEVRAALRGDLHSHSTWSDGGAPVEAMARTAAALGHEYLVVTDHSPRLAVARGLTPERLEAQLDEIAELNERLAPFEILAGIEVDILGDGSLDQRPDLLDRLDLVVASAHSELKMPHDEMTRRLVAAIANPRTDVVGHVTNRMRAPEGSKRKGRPESTFDADVVLAACDRFGKALEINCRPERLDPPMRILGSAVEVGVFLSIDTDAHAPGQLEWQAHGCDRAAAAGADPDLVVNTWSASELRAWVARHRAGELFEAVTSE